MMGSFVQSIMSGNYPTSPGSNVSRLCDVGAFCNPAQRGKEGPIHYVPYIVAASYGLGKDAKNRPGGIVASDDESDARGQTCIAGVYSSIWRAAPGVQASHLQP